MSDNGLGSKAEKLWSDELVRRVTETDVFSRFLTTAPVPAPTLRQSLRWHWLEGKRRVTDAYKVLIHGADLMDEDEY
ncbi:hypothetical protein KAR91_11780 [Candidatus Pacearchaeota archaeon]|nr:hypothetical protein [Candidatus Pacearchaeota archaeon]